MFDQLEDVTGLMNVVVSKGCWIHYRRGVDESPELLVRGRLERVDGVTNVIAHHIEPLQVDANVRSRYFRSNHVWCSPTEVGGATQPPRGSVSAGGPAVGWRQ